MYCKQNLLNAKTQGDFMQEPIRILVADPITFPEKPRINADFTRVSKFVESLGWDIHHGSAVDIDNGKSVTYFYIPDLDEGGIIQETNRAAKAGKPYDVCIVAATPVNVEKNEVTRGYLRMGTGVNQFDFEALIAKGNFLMNQPGVNARATASVTTKCVLDAYLPDVKKISDQVKSGNILTTAQALKENPVRGVEGLKLAIIGITGGIGWNLFQMLSPHGIKNIFGWARSFTEEDALDIGIRYAKNPTEATQGANILSVNIPYDGKNDGFVSEQILNSLADGALVINAARGQLINIDALRSAIISGKVGKVVVDADAILDAEGQHTSKSTLKPYLDLAKEFEGAIDIITSPHVFVDSNIKVREALFIRASIQLGLAFGILPESLIKQHGLSADFTEKKVLVNSILPVREPYINGGEFKPPFGKVTPHELKEIYGRNLGLVELVMETSIAYHDDPTNPLKAADFHKMLLRAAMLVGQRPVIGG